jgi:hypothetical protein
MKATLTLSTNPKLPIELGYDQIESIMSSFPDTTELAPVYAEFAKHPASSVREQVAYKDKLDAKTVKLLAGDKEIVVVRNLIRSEGGRKHLDTKILLALIAKDVEVAESIANNVEGYESADIDELVTALLKHEDPRVRAALAGNSGTPKKHVKTLQKDADSRVRATADATLSY